MRAKSNRKLKSFAAVPFIAMASLLLTAIAAQFGPFRLLDYKVYDAMVQSGASNAQTVAPDVALIVIDDQSRKAIREPLAYWQPHFAVLLRALSDAHARAVGLDMIFSAADDRAKGESKQLAQAVADAEASGTPVILGYDASSPLPSSPLYLLASTDSPRPLGYLNLPADPDDFVRRFDPCKPDDHELAFSFGARLASSALAKEFDCSREEFGREVRITLDGQHSAYIPFGRAPAPTQTSLADVLALAENNNSAEIAKRFSGKIVLIGSDEPQDRHATPGLREGSGRVPGVEIHAIIVQSIYSGIVLRNVPAALTWLVAFVIAIAVAAVIFAFRLEVSASGALVFVVFSVLPGFIAWRSMWVMSDATLLLSTAFSGGIAFVYRYRAEFVAHRKLRNQFSQYVSPEVVERIIEHGVELGGTRRKITVLFSDIRGFTTLSERTAPENLVAQLNEYLSAMSEVIISHGGYLDKFIGDGILAIYGAPVEQKDAAWKAVSSAMKMLERLAELNAKWKAEGRNELDIGIGIHSGEAIVGNIGSWRKLEYTAVGDTVNTASRIESKTKQSIQRYNAHVLISGATVEELESWDHFADIFAMDIEQLKGKSELTQLFVVRGLHGAGRKGSAANA
ncbi:MAG: putative transrane sensor domain protein [Candidatus Angelobacter sp.]|jgi:adenylate cyclase|nr:putative transrane sensor domain protein [Candidatus Angelobacter sp.]